MGSEVGWGESELVEVGLGITGSNLVEDGWGGWGGRGSETVEEDSGSELADSEM